MRALKTCLWIGAAGCFTSIAGVIIPVRMFESILISFGAEARQITPMLQYFILLTSATYVAIGMFLAFLARQPEEYGIMVPFAALASVALGILCTITGLTLPLSVKLYIGDALPLTLWGVLTYGFWKKTTKTKQKNTPTT